MSDAKRDGFEQALEVFFARSSYGDKVLKSLIATHKTRPFAEDEQKKILSMLRDQWNPYQVLDVISEAKRGIQLQAEDWRLFEQQWEREEALQDFYQYLLKYKFEEGKRLKLLNQLLEDGSIFRTFVNTIHEQVALLKMRSQEKQLDDAESFYNLMLKCLEKVKEEKQKEIAGMEKRKELEEKAVPLFKELDELKRKYCDPKTTEEGKQRIVDRVKEIHEGPHAWSVQSKASCLLGGIYESQNKFELALDCYSTHCASFGEDTFHVARFFRDGLGGVKKNEESALTYFNIAIGLGFKPAQAERDALAAKLAASEKKEEGTVSSTQEQEEDGPVSKRRRQ